MLASLRGRAILVMRKLLVSLGIHFSSQAGWRGVYFEVVILGHGEAFDKILAVIRDALLLRFHTVQSKTPVQHLLNLRIAMKSSILKGGTSRIAAVARFDLPQHSHCNPQLRQPLHNSHRLQTHAYHLPNQPQNILRIIPPVRIVHNPAALVRLDAVLVDDPFERGAIAEAIVESFGGNAVQRQEVIVAELRLCPWTAASSPRASRAAFPGVSTCLSRYSGCSS